MTCETAETLLHQSLDKPLTQPERMALDSHWQVCAACRREQDAQRRLALLAGRWAEQAVAASDPGEVFTTQLLARLEASPKLSPLSFGLPLAVTVLLLTALALLPGLPSGSIGALAPSLCSLPHWLAVNLLAVPGDALALRQMPQAAFAPPWMSALLPLAIGLNAVFCLHARQAALQRSVS